MESRSYLRLQRVVLHVLLCVFAVTCFASPPETVIVPYDASKPLAGQKPDQLYVPYERFIELWEAAKANRRPLQPERLDVPYLLNSARYDGVLKEGTISFRGVIELNTFGEAWVSVPLKFDKPGALMLDGEPASFDGEKLIVAKPGRHRVEVWFDVPTENNRAAWRIPRTPGTLVSITLPQTRMRATISPGNAVVEKVSGTQKIVAAVLGETDKVSLALDTSAAVTHMAEPAVAQVRSQLTVTQAQEVVETEFAFSFPEARQERFMVFFDKNCVLVDLRAGNLKSWKLSTDAQRQTLEITLAEPVKDKFSFSVTCERSLPALPADERFPFFSAMATRVEQSVALFAERGVELMPKPSATFRQISWKAASTPVLRLVAAFTTTGSDPLAYQIRSAELPREAAVNYVYQFNSRKIELIASFTLESKQRELFDTTITLPAEFEIQAVQSARLKDWWRDGNKLHVRFREATPDQTALAVYLVRLYPAAPDKLELAPLTLEGFTQVRGEAIVAAHKGVKATLALSSDSSDARAAREISPDAAAKDFAILPPLERKRAFSFKQQNFRGSVTLEALPARASAVWVMSAQAHEGWVAVSTRARVSIRQGSLSSVIFSLPASAPEARIAGGEVRDVVSRVEGTRRVYQVGFQNDVYEQAEFTAGFELSGAEAIFLPSPEFIGVERIEGFVLVQNVSDYEMRLDPHGLDVAQRAEIPFLPAALLQSASLFRAQPGWSLGITMSRLEKTAGRDAFVAWVEITTAIRENGVEWNRAVYRLQNRSLQFLPVKLPPDAELVSTRVAGQSVRADAGRVDKQSVILIPLIKTKPGDLSYDVEVVYRITKRGRLGAFAHRTLDDPEVVGITIEKTLWNVWVPDDYPLTRMSDRRGKMDMVIEELNRTEKLEGALEELKNLASLAASSSAGEGARRKAEQNYRSLAKTVEIETSQTNGDRLYHQGDAENLGRKAAAQQQNVVARKQVLQQELASTKNKVEAAVAKAREQPTAQQGAQALASEVNAWAANKDYREKASDQPSAKPAAPKTPVAQTGANLYITDNVILQDARPVIQKEGTIKRDTYALDALLVKESAQTEEKAGELKKSQVSTYAGGTTVSAGKLEIQPRGDVSGVGAPAGQIILDTARSNAAVVAQQPSVPTQAAVVGGSAPVSSIMSPTAVPGLPEPDARRAQAMPQVDVAAAQSARGSGQAEQTVSSPEREAQQLRPTGRLSLVVDFPTEGRVYHFKKLKADATLDLWLRSTESISKWKCALAFIVFAGLLAVSSRIRAAHPV